MEPIKNSERPRRNFHCRLLILLAVTVTTGIYWNVQNYLTSKEQTEYQLLKQEWQQLSQDTNLLNIDAQLLAEDNHQKMQQIALQQATEIELQNHLAELQDQVLDLEKELLFYQNITQNNSSELQVKEVLLQADKHSTELIHYRLVLTQGTRITNPITGDIVLSLQGISAGKESTVEIVKIPFSLRYVQVLEGQINLIDGLIPQQILITIKQKKKKSQLQSFEWIITPSD